MLLTMPVSDVLKKLRSGLQSNYTTDYAENTHVTMFLCEVNMG